MKFLKTTTALFTFFLFSYLIYLVFQIQLSGNETKALKLRTSSEKDQKLVDLEIFKTKMHFEPNYGQVEDKVQYISRGKGYDLFLAPNKAVLSLQRPGDYEKEELTSSVVRMRIEGANPNPKSIGQYELPGKSNYFIGSDPDKWLTNIPNFGTVKYTNVYKGIDLMYYGNEGQLEYDFIVSPEGNPKDIVLDFEDGEKPHIDSQGNLVFMDKNQKLFMKPPIAYQTRKGIQEIVGAKYAYLGKDRIVFEIGDYEKQIPLVIDPVIIFSTYLGNNSAGSDAQAIAVDTTGIYITGSTGSHKFPTTHTNLVPNFTGPDHVFITKMNTEGTELIYSTYFGGHNDDVPWGIAVDDEGNILVVGRAMSDDFPLVNAIQTEYKGDGISLAGDGFIVKLDPEGDRLVYSTYMGGDWDDEARDVAVDKAGNAFVTGITTSPSEFPFKNTLPLYTCDDSYDKGFVMKFDPTGNLEFSTCLGGEKNGASGYGIATDTEDNVYITGATYAGFPTTSGAYRSDGNGVFVAKINNSGTSVIYSTYISGTQYEPMGRGESIVIDTMGNAYIAGRCTHADFPMVNAFQPNHANSGWFNNDGFVSKLSADGSSLLFSSFIGGDHHDQNLDIDLDKSGNIYISGITQSNNFPTVEAFQSSLNGNTDAFIAMIDGENYSLAFSTYFGGSKWEGGDVDKVSLAVSSDGYVYVAGYTGSTDFPTENAYQETSTTSDAFVLKLLIIEKGVLEVSPNPVVFPLTEIGQTSKKSVELSNSGIGALEIKKLEVEPNSLYTIENKPDLPHMLDPDEKVEFQVAFSPTSSTGGRTNSSGAGTITIETDAEEPVSKVSLIPGLVVNKTGDESDADLADGVCDVDLAEMGAQVTLRAAIEHINHTKSNEVTLVIFDIPGDEVPIIKPESPLPEIEYPISLDASKQNRGYVVLDGTNAGSETRALHIISGNSTVKSMNIMNFGSEGVYLEGKGSNLIDDCVITENGDGGIFTNAGIEIFNTAENKIKDCVISRNAGNGISIKGVNATENLVEGNKIGTRLSGMEILSNGKNGISIEEKANKNYIRNNLISGNLVRGIYVGADASYNEIEQNKIGTNIDGKEILANLSSGISLSGCSTNHIWDNLISGNKVSGIYILNANSNMIMNNKIGTSENGSQKLPNEINGIVIGQNSKYNQIRKNLISGNNDNGILITAGAKVNAIIYNLIGLNIDGTAVLSNQNVGISITEDGTKHNRVLSNHISGNGGDGIHIGPRSNTNTISDNLIGTDSTGSIDIGNGRHGINIEYSDNIQVQKNTIVNNADQGINIAIKSDQNLSIVENYIGIDQKNPQRSFGNGTSGIYLLRGRMSASSNWIAGNADAGIHVIDGSVKINENRIYDNKTGLRIGRSGNHVGLALYYSIVKNVFEDNQSGITIEGFVVLKRDEPAYENIQGNSIWNNSGSNTGIHIKNARAKIRGNLLYNNLGNAITVEGESEVTVDLNNIVENQEFGLQNLTPSISVKAMYNWWADSTGPGGSGSGLGDKVSDGVDYSNWMKEYISVFIAAENDTVLIPIGRPDSVTLIMDNWAQIDDNLNVSVDDDLGWIQNSSPYQVPIPYYSHELSQLYLTIPSDVENRTYNEIQLSATSQKDPQDTFKTSFTILAVEPAAISLLISPDTMEVLAGDSIQFEVSGYDQFYNPIEEVDWSCTGGTVDDAGLFIAGNNNGYFTVIAEESVSGITAVAQVMISGAVPTGLEVADNLDEHQSFYSYPNPFYNTATIKYRLKTHGNVCLKVYNISGKVVVKLVDGMHRAGEYEVIWKPIGLPGGIYFSTLEVDSGKSNQKQLHIEAGKLIYVK